MALPIVGVCGHGVVAQVSDGHQAVPGIESVLKLLVLDEVSGLVVEDGRRIAARLDLRDLVCRIVRAVFGAPVRRHGRPVVLGVERPGLFLARRGRSALL